MTRKLSPIHDVLYRIKRGLSGYISYLAACEMNEAFSEYILYEPTLRILTARGFHVICEYPCPGFKRKGPGDSKKIDFVAKKKDLNIAIEMKWARKTKITISDDIEKLKKYIEHTKDADAFLCVFGRKSHIQNITLEPNDLIEQGNAVFAEFGITKYGCRIYKIKKASQIMQKSQK